MIIVPPLTRQEQSELDQLAEALLAAPPQASVKFPPARESDASDVLQGMADTYRERNKVYGDNFRNVGHVMAALHPRGAGLQTPADHELFHLWSLLIVKLTRFANSDLTHIDSIHDAAVYAAMIEAILQERKA